MVRKTIEELSKEYDYLFVDTCALTNDFSSNRRIGTSVLEKTRQLKQDLEYIKFFSDFLKSGGNLHITSEILDESSFRLKSSTKKGAYKKRKQFNTFIDRVGLPSNFDANLVHSERKFLDSYCDTIREMAKTKRAFLNEMVISGRVISFVEKDKVFYNTLRDQYSFLKNKHKIGENDFNTLMSSGLYALNKGKTCLVTNDYNLFSAGLTFAINARLNDNFRLYSREGFNSFLDGIPDRMNYSPVANN